MSGRNKTVYCVGSPLFDPKSRIDDAKALQDTLTALKADDFASAIEIYFQLPANDTYAYQATATVTLPLVQHVVSLGGANQLHAWYALLPEVTEDNPQEKRRPQPLPSPPQADITAYTSIFLPTTLTSSALKSFLSNAKKGSIRFSAATNLLSKYFITPHNSELTVPKIKPNSATLAALPRNPYLDLWIWSCHNLEWCGPAHPESELRSASHHVLPVLMHHFGCAVPSHESCAMIKMLSERRTVVDMGSGNGYWTFMLRQYGVDVVAVDNEQSSWRVTWIDDTQVVGDGAKWLGTTKKGGEELVLLVVYPVVGSDDGGFMRSLMAAYKGDTVCVAGTQNGNGYTGFKSMTFDAYMEREQAAWTKVVQIPIPSFAGKDEALYVYQRGKRASKANASQSG